MISKKSKNGKESLSDRAYRELKSLILDNKLQVGAHFLEQEVAELLNMSRTPSREALLRLSNEGLIEIRSRHGMRVKPISIQDMKEIYEILTSLEATAASLAAQIGLDESQIANLRQAVDDMERSLAKDQLEAWAEADERFHRLLVEYSENRRLIALVGNFIDQSHRVRIMTLRMRPKPVNSVADHRAVMEAIIRGDAEAAWRLHQKHREGSGKMLVDILDSHSMRQL